jgi:hypothetical protein
LFKRSIALIQPTPGPTITSASWADHNVHLKKREMIQQLQIDPNNGAYLDSLGWLDYRRGD